AHASHTALSGAWDGQRLSAEVEATAVRLRSSGGAPKGWQAELPATSIRTTLRSGRDGVEGALHVEANQVAARVGQTAVEGAFVAALDVRSQDRSNRVAGGSGVG